MVLDKAKEAWAEVVGQSSFVTVHGRVRERDRGSIHTNLDALNTICAYTYDCTYTYLRTNYLSKSVCMFA